MRKHLLRFVAVLSLCVPFGAAGLRVRDVRAAERALAEGIAVLDTPMERVPALDALDIHRALRSLEHASTRLSDTPERRQARALWHVARGLDDLVRGDFSLSAQECELAQRLVPNEPHAILVRAAADAHRGERSRAERALARIDRAPLDARAMHLRAEILLDLQRPHEALAVAEALDGRYPRLATVKNLLGLSRAATGDRPGALAAYEQAIELDPRAHAPLVNRARIERESGELMRSRRTLERALGVAPENGEVWLAYGIVLADLRDRGARAALVRAGTLLADDPAPWVAQGNLDLAAGDLRAAQESFRNALARDAEHTIARTNLGIVLARQGQRLAAIEAFEQATRRAPHQGEAWNGLGAMRLAIGDAERAIGPLQQASVLLPEDPNPPMNLGLALEALQRWDDAARAYREALRRQPGHEAALRRLLAITPPALRDEELRRIGPLAHAAAK